MLISKCLKRLNNRSRGRRTGSKLSAGILAVDHQVDTKEIIERAEIIEVAMAAEIELLKREEIGDPRIPQDMNMLEILGGEVKISMIPQMQRKLKLPPARS